MECTCVCIVLIRAFLECSYMFGASSAIVPAFYISSDNTQLLSVATDMPLPIIGVSGQVTSLYDGQCTLESLEVNSGNGFSTFNSTGFSLTFTDNQAFLEVSLNSFPLT